jgi:NAD+ kinase
MRVKVYGPEREKLKNFIRKNYPEIKIIQKVEKNPDLIICYGGDGTLLLAERLDPGIPKVGIRNSQICNVCRHETRDTVLQLLKEKKFQISEHYKIEATCQGQTVTALNDIIIAHYHVNTALRFKVFVDDLPYGGEFLGDGIVAATPIGSTGYYQAITRSNFQEGIGVAFSNTVNIIGHIVLNDRVKIKVLITRGPGRLRYDNDKSQMNLKEGDEVFIHKSKHITKLVNFSGANKKFNIDISHNRLPLGYCQICRKYYM